MLAQISSYSVELKGVEGVDNISPERESEEDTWTLVNIIEPADVGRPIERVQAKMESLVLPPISPISPQTNGTTSSDELKPQPLPPHPDNGESHDGEAVLHMQLIGNYFFLRDIVVPSKC